MPVTNFPEYAQGIEAVLGSLIATGEATLTDIRIDQRSSLRGFIAGMLQFNDGSELHFREFVDASRTKPKLMYAYHYQSRLLGNSRGRVKISHGFHGLARKKIKKSV
ncbi:MAG: hypothetical protein U9Q70_01265 [Chloroflexota bacterium]|nr:hypothetical protein [Chloroflexota bacterium]